MDRNNLLIATRAEFMAAFNQEIPGLLAQATSQLFSNADTARSMVEQRRLLAARHVLMSQSSALETHLVRALEHLLHRSFQTAYSNFRPSFVAGATAMGLSLVEASSFEEELQIDQITSRFRVEADDALRDLNIRIALLFEQDVIKERENPFRPYLISRSLATALEETVSDKELVAPLLEQLTESMAPRIAPIYDQLNNLLAEHGIAAQLQLKIRKQPDLSQLPAVPPQFSEADLADAMDAAISASPSFAAAGTSGTTGANSGGMSPISMAAETSLGDSQAVQNDGAASPSPAMGQVGQVGNGARAGATRSEDQLMDFVQSSSRASFEEGIDANPFADEISGGIPSSKSWLQSLGQAGHTLKQFFSGRRAIEDADAASFDSPALRVVSAPLAHSIHNLIQVATPTTEAMLDSNGQIRNLILEQRHHLSDMASDADEAMTIDVVAMLFEFILRDGKVPAEVRAQLGRLQFLVLKIALQDPNLFASKSHPARLLVNRIGSIALGMQQDAASAESVNREICRIVAVILADGGEDLSIFTKMLDELDGWVATELAHCEALAADAQYAIDHAKQRTLHFARITAMISDALSGFTIEPYLHDFLENSWSRAIELAGREQPDKAQRFRLLVPDLIWSLAPKVDRDECKLLLGLIPSMFATLREGVASLSWTPEQVQELNTHLVDAHRLAMRAGNAQLDMLPPPLSVFHERFQPLIAASLNSVTSEAEAKAPLNPQFLGEAIGKLEKKLNLIDQIIAQELGEADSVEIAADMVAEAAVARGEDPVTQQLKNGVAVEVNITGQVQLAQLSWSPATMNTIVLLIAGENKPSVLSLRAFRRLYARDRVRFIEDSPIFDRAMNSLLKSAEALDAQ